MSVYVLNLFFVWLMAIFASKTKLKGKKSLNEFKPNLLFVFPLLVSLVLVCGLRWRVGTDFISYVQMYSQNSLRTLQEILQLDDPGFMLLQWITSRQGYYPVHMFMIMAIITTSFAILTVYRYSATYHLSIYLYVAGMVYYTQFNGVRQALAASIMLLGLKYIFNNSFWKYLLVVVLASTVHASAIVLIPIYFTVRRRPFSLTIGLLIALSILGFILFNDLMQVIGSFGGKYSHYADLSGAYSSYGIKPIRVIVASIPFIVSVFFHKRLVALNQRNAVFVNFALLNFLVALLASRNVALARISFYFSFYDVLLIPEFVKIVKPKYRPIIYFLICVLYLLYMMVLVSVESNLLPYRTFFTQ